MSSHCRLHRATLSPLPVLAATFVAMLLASSALATPANKAALERHFDRFLSKELSRCTTCHLPSDRKSPATLDEFPHNPFGHRLRLLGQKLQQSGAKPDLATRLVLVAREDSDGDGVANETELLLGHAPGDPNDFPGPKELAEAGPRQAEFARLLASYRWQPFEPVRRPPVPAVKNRRWVRNPIDAFIAAEQEAHQLLPRTEATREVLLRRIYLDLTGLSPTPAEQRAFLSDASPDAYEKLVDRLLEDPRYGERWGRHWMDVWRYSDWAGWTDGGQIRDSQPHIWRWRDWIVESLNDDKPYDRMILEMLAADELAPDDAGAVRATGFLARNYKMLSREQWLEDTVKHTSMAFLGVTVGCAKCHDHMFDPIAQTEYYQMRAIFEPHQVRIDRVPGQINTALDGLVRVFDVETNPPTWVFVRGDERHPDTNHLMAAGVPRALGGELKVERVPLPRAVAEPDQREFVIRDRLAASSQALVAAREALARLKTNAAAKPEKLREQELSLEIAERKEVALRAVLQAEWYQQMGRDRADSSLASAPGLKELLGLASGPILLPLEVAIAGTNAAKAAAQAQRDLSLAEARLKWYVARIALEGLQAKTNAAKPDLDKARVKRDEAAQSLAAAEREGQAPPTTAYKSRPAEKYPATSTGRRLAFARWVANGQNPLTARVAMNHIWLRHFGRGLVPTPSDFGRNGRPASHPALLDWLAAEFSGEGNGMGSGVRGPGSEEWSMKRMHRLMVTSSTYRLSSTPDRDNAKLDPDNIFLWRMNSRRLEAEAVRDNLLWVSGTLDRTMGGPDIDNQLGLTSRRRSLYLRHAAEKEVEFLKIFDGPSVTECYERKPSVMPQQALALANSEVALSQARLLARQLSGEARESAAEFVSRAFLWVLARKPTRAEIRLSTEFLAHHHEDHPSDLFPPATSIAHQAVKRLPPVQPAADPDQRARENFILVLMNHNDFVTVR